MNNKGGEVASGLECHVNLKDDKLKSGSKK